MRTWRALAAEWPDAAATARPLALQEWIVLLYLSALGLALALGRGPGWQHELCSLVLDASVVLGGVWVSRARSLGIPPTARTLLHRLAVFLPVLVSYLQLREILPAVRSDTVDVQLLELDGWLFGVEPAVAWDAWVTPARTEWFALFYGSYFLLLAVGVLGFLLAVSDGDLFGPFSVGLLLVYCTAHLLYLAVPGYGPHHLLADSFSTDLGDGPIWRVVREIVRSGGAQKDIFPSLHTAAPVFLALFAWRHRRRARVFSVSAPALTFFASQIVVATMYLRWHWLIDVLAGLVLAVGALAAGELLHRRAAGLGGAGAPEPAFGTLPWGLRALGGDAPGLCGRRDPRSGRARPEAAGPG